MRNNKTIEVGSRVKLTAKNTKTYGIVAHFGERAIYIRLNMGGAILIVPYELIGQYWRLSRYFL